MTPAGWGQAITAGGERLTTDLAGFLDRFVDRLRARLTAIAATNGDTSITRPAAELVEIPQELEDVAGWGILLWLRLEQLPQHVDAIAAAGGARGRS